MLTFYDGRRASDTPSPPPSTPQDKISHSLLVTTALSGTSAPSFLFLHTPPIPELLFYFPGISQHPYIYNLPPSPIHHSPQQVVCNHLTLGKITKNVLRGAAVAKQSKAWWVLGRCWERHPCSHVSHWCHTNGKLTILGPRQLSLVSDLTWGSARSLMAQELSGLDIAAVAELNLSRHLCLPLKQFPSFWQSIQLSKRHNCLGFLLGDVVGAQVTTSGFLIYA